MSNVDPNLESRGRPSDGERPHSRELVKERLGARRQRLRLIRRRVMATGVSVFALAWGVIFVQLVSGHDPALAHAKTHTATASPSSGSSSAGSSSARSSSGSATPSTTSQS